jgi:RNA polymerase sigma factor (sigma-70 family)
MTYRDQRDALILAHRGLVRGVARSLKKILPMHISFEELCGYGYIALVISAERFDPSRGVSFRAYATRRISGEMRDFMRKDNIAPRSAYTKDGDPPPQMISIFEDYGSDRDFLDVLEDRSPTVLDRLTRSELPDSLVRSLCEVDHRILLECFIKERTVKDVAGELGLSSTRVWQIKKRVARHARRWYIDHGYNPQ